MSTTHQHIQRPNSLWEDTLSADERCAEEPLESSMSADITIIGAGLTGLWSAYYLSQQLPDADIVVIDTAGVGFGASGRNGGWASALLPMGLERIEREHGRDAATQLQTEMHSTLDEIQRVLAAESIDAAEQRGGTFTAARSAPQLKRVAHEVSTYQRFGFGDEYHFLNGAAASDVCNMSELAGAMFTPHCIAVNPAKLTHGIGRAVVRNGVRILSPVRATALGRGSVTTDRGTISTKYIVQATEGYTSDIDGQHRNMVPLYSMMIATEPLPDDMWDTIGLANRPTFDDTRHLIVYGQRTADGRLAFGGRGAPYHFGSAIRPTFDTNTTMRNRIRAALVDLFPAVRDARITHHWGGPLGIPRNWACSVHANWSDGIVTAGGYVGDGVSATNLFGRIVADLITEREHDSGQHDRSDLLRLPVVGPLSRRWEPEPIRWMGINAGRVAARFADMSEHRTGKTSRFLGGVIDGLLRR